MGSWTVTVALCREGCSARELNSDSPAGSHTRHGTSGDAHSSPLAPGRQPARQLRTTATRLARVREHPSHHRGAGWEQGGQVSGGHVSLQLEQWRGRVLCPPQFQPSHRLLPHCRPLPSRSCWPIPHRSCPSTSAISYAQHRLLPDPCLRGSSLPSTSLRSSSLPGSSQCVPDPSEQSDRTTSGCSLQPGNNQHCSGSVRLPCRCGTPHLAVCWTGELLLVYWPG